MIDRSRHGKPPESTSHPACRITHFICNIHIGGLSFTKLWCLVDHLVGTDWNCWWVSCFYCWNPHVASPCLQRSPTYKISSEIWCDPIREKPRVSSERAGASYAFQMSVIFPHRDALGCQSHKSWKQAAWWTAALYLQANWRALPWLRQKGLELLSGEQFEPSSPASRAASLGAHHAHNQETSAWKLASPKPRRPVHPCGRVEHSVSGHPRGGGCVLIKMVIIQAQKWGWPPCRNCATLLLYRSFWGTDINKTLWQVCHHHISAH